MNIEIKPVLAGLVGMLILLIPITVQTTENFLPHIQNKDWAEPLNNKAIEFPLHASNMRGLYGYRYRGF